MPAVIPAEVHTGPSTMKMRFHIRESGLQVARLVPVRGRATAVKQTCLGEGKRAETSRSDPPASPWSRPHELD
jgi:hypothetical protein